MPKSKNRPSHSQKVSHQRMLDKHKSSKRKKEIEEQLKQLQTIQENNRLRKEAARAEHMKAIISGDIQHNSELLLDARKGVIMSESN